MQASHLPFKKKIIKGRTIDATYLSQSWPCNQEILCLLQAGRASCNNNTCIHAGASRHWHTLLQGWRTLQGVTWYQQHCISHWQPFMMSSWTPLSTDLPLFCLGCPLSVILSLLYSVTMLYFSYKVRVGTAQALTVKGISCNSHISGWQEHIDLNWCFPHLYNCNLL